MLDLPRPGCRKHSLRRDAQRNRDLIMEAARRAFAEQGIDAPLEAVARRAGVAIGTVYRHFPTRTDLIESIFIDKLHAWIEAGEQALAMADAWDAFAFYLERLCELQAADRGFNDVVSMRLPRAGQLEEARDSAHELTCRIISRARQQGVLRDDVTAEDITLLVWANARIIEATHAVVPRAWRRHLGLMLDAFRAERARPIPEPPMCPADVHQAMLTLGSSGCPGR